MCVRACVPWYGVCLHCRTMRLIAERMLPADNSDNAQFGAAHPAPLVYMQIEEGNQRVSIEKPREDARYHIYCSEHNAGATDLMAEVARSQGWNLMSVARSSNPSKDKKDTLIVCDKSEGLTSCEHMAIYLNARTWSDGEASQRFAEDVRQATARGIPLKLFHESPGIGQQDERHPCEFAEFFASARGSTPRDLLQLGIYDTVAVPLKGGDWRNASMTLAAKSLAESRR